MENAGGQARVHAFEREQCLEILHAARAAGSDDGNLHARGHGGEHFQIEAALHAVGIDAVEHQFPRAARLALRGPFQRVHAGIHAAALGEHAVLPIHALGVDGEHHALVAVFLRRLVDQFWMGDGAGIHAHLVRARLEHAVEIRHGIDAAAHRERNENALGHAREHIGEQGALFHAGGDVVKHQLVRAALVVKLRQRDRVFHALHVFEIHALHHAAIADVQTGNDSLGDHAPSSASFSTSARFSAPEYSALPTMAAGTPISRRARTSSRVETPPEATISSPSMPSSVR